MSFIINELLAQDSHYLTSLELCQVRLMDNSCYPWVILVPPLTNITEITDFNERDYALFNQETAKVCRAMQKRFNPDKLNIAIIGNIVPQLHLHIVARFKSDKSFPRTVWGEEFVRYSDGNLKTMMNIVCEALE